MNFPEIGSWPVGVAFLISQEKNLETWDSRVSLGRHRPKAPLRTARASFPCKRLKHSAAINHTLVIPAYSKTEPHVYASIRAT